MNNLMEAAMWHGDQLLGNDRKVSSHTRLLLGNGSVNKGHLLGNGPNKHAHTMEELLGAVFTVWSMPRPYSEGQLPLEESLDMAVGVRL
jgi:hypothetical protein